MIEGVIFTPLTQITDERGKIMRMLRVTDPIFQKFGEIYFSCAWPGAVKGWHLHKSMTLNLAVISGNAKFMCYDYREHSATYGVLDWFYLGESNYGLLTIPPGVYSGYAVYGDKLAIVANCATEPHDKNEIIYQPWNRLPGSTSGTIQWLDQHG